MAIHTVGGITPLWEHFGHTPLLDDEASRHRALETVMALSEALNLSLDLTHFADQAAYLLHQYTGMPAAGVFVLDDGQTRLLLKGQHGLADELLPLCQEFDRYRSLTGRALEEGRIIHVRAIENDGAIVPEIRDGLLRFGFEGAICVPIQQGQHAVGAANLLHRTYRPLSELEKETLLAMGRTLALAMLNALHIRRLQEAETALAAANAELEAKVARRTSQLEHRNAQLKAEISARRTLESALRKSEERYRLLSITDELTGLFNARHFRDGLEREINQHARQGLLPPALILLDVDNFKQFNDSEGHLAGDEVLAALGSVIRSQLRERDRAFRYGGEEFAVLLPETTLSDAANIAERIRAAFAGAAIVLPEGRNARLSASVGVASYVNGETMRHFIRRADAAMYRAKQAGKDRVVLDE